MANTSLIIGDGNWAVKEGSLLGYNVIQNKYVPIEMDVVRATTATRVNADGLIEEVGLNVPRVDYPVSGGCPSLLLEPQRTNLLSRSQEFENAAWTKINVIVTPDSIISPNDLTTAETATETAVSGFHSIAKGGIWTSGVQLTASIFAKKKEREFILIGDLSVGNAGVFFNLNTGVISSTTSPSFVGKIESFGNGWYKCSVTYTAPANRTLGYSIAQSDGVFNYLGDGTSGIFIWGAQLEQGSTATSYIPTVESTVTRNADVISKTGISDLIGQTEGTIYAEVDFTASNLRDRTIIDLSNNSASNWIFIRTSAISQNGMRFRISNGGALQFDYNSSALSTGIHKFCLLYELNNISVYIDGVKLNTSNTATIPLTFKLSLGCMYNNDNQLDDSINSAVLFKTALTDAECIALTTL